MPTSGVSNISLNSTEVQNCGQEWSGSQLSLQSSNSIGSSNSFDVMDSHCVGDIDTYIPPITIKNRPDPDIIKPNKFPTGKDAYLDAVLLKEVNRDGKAPLWLRPLAALLALLGIHGFGQTNCASCATAVAETLEKNDVYLAMPKLRGADVKGIMGLPVNSGKSFDERLTKLQQLKPEDKLLTKLQQLKSTDDPLTILQQLKREDELNGVIVIHRPARWQWLPGATQGHACNLIKFKDSNFIHFFDAQKKTYVECHLNNIVGKGAQISKFLGPIGAGGIDLYMKKMHADINKKAGASAPA
ncbi:toxin glutamine deamidase domain-containing protein [Yersinia enterocolitica]|uniref:toxin glutamine deamidase domain-containing protein n=1 Tax=Yersinia enterocolitica TaxID=630 RepID=UPI0021E7CBA0|nr:toxin glutamine deamidase domain-containing protein [Yersinia enterocolitica]MCV3314092.1 toxin glutamine deamidase domain-containing protein [Yersinia enterocolitica]UYJ89232.1 toxin glutamine deamidase domain-containing protein [Yersinia enterocolitica]UYJ93224.1 toxin glutamine deamidase domain-containing protein [Yersinia enterocolitica]UYK22734.1 toxin glutamine deamidase domain-containing protein [Yersinia enterocolitica]UYK26713.1 toxin glutamine deamidase domain-containing protein [